MIDFINHHSALTIHIYDSNDANLHNQFQLLLMNTAINLLSVVPMRKEAAHRSEMVSQLLFGEYVKILEEEEYFSKVKCLYDGYEGWVQSNQLTAVNEVLEPTGMLTPG